MLPATVRTEGWGLGPAGARHSEHGWRWEGASEQCYAALSASCGQTWRETLACSASAEDRLRANRAPERRIPAGEVKI